MYLKELAEDVGVSYNLLLGGIKKGAIKANKTKKGFKLDQEEVDYVRQMAQLPKLSDYIKRDHRKYPCVLKLCNSGKIHCTMFLGHYRLYMDSVEIIKRITTWDSTRDIKKKFGISPTNFKIMIKNGYIQGEKIFGMWYVDKANFIKLKEYKNALTKKGYMKKYPMDSNTLDYLIETNGLDTFKFGKRLMIKDN